MQNALATCSKQTFAHCCHMQAQLLISCAVFHTPLSPAMWMMIIIITIVITIVLTIIIIIIIIIVIVIIIIIVVVVVNIISLLV